MCQVVPTFASHIEAKVCDYNEHLKWGETNGVAMIKTKLAFRRGTGEVDELRFDEQDDGLVSNLNRRSYKTSRHSCNSVYRY